MTGSPTDAESQSARFYAAAASRMLKSILVFGIVITPLVAYRYGWLAGLGFAIGAAVSGLNFYELVRGVRGRQTASLTPIAPNADAPSSCVSSSAISWSVWSPMLYSKVLLRPFEAFCLVCACQSRRC